MDFSSQLAGGGANFLQQHTTTNPELSHFPIYGSGSVVILTKEESQREHIEMLRSSA